ncbi:MAG: SPOR domain-containing protein [Treponema sp.]|nr:SPOR domain-containing protein [Treponema sp.]
MEQKRTLWIIAAVGIFLLVVLGAALIVSSASRNTQGIAATAPVSRPHSDGWIYPSEQSSGKQNAMMQNEQSDATSPAPFGAQQQHAPFDEQLPHNALLGEQRVPSQSAFPPAPGAQPYEPVTRVNDMTVIAQNATVYGIEKNYTSEQTALSRNESSDGTLIDLNALKTAPKETSAVTPKNEASAQKIEEVKKTVYAPPANAVPVQSAPPKSTAQTTTAGTAPKNATAKPAAPKAVAKTPAKTTTQYWVQAASFANKGGADTARTVLDDNKIPADVFTYKDSKGTVYYRVRIGPYMTKSEAEYWRTRVAQITEFKSTESYVTQTSSVAN